MLGKIKADFRKNWLSWAGLIGLAVICVSLAVYCLLESKALTPCDSHMLEVNILMRALVGWTIAYLVMYFLIRHNMVQEWRQELRKIRKNKNRSKDNDSND